MTVAVPVLRRIANFDDFDPLKLEPAVRLVFVRAGEALPVADLVVLPGSKATIADLADFRQQCWHVDLAGHVRRGGRVLGVCGGYQMLGRRVADPQGIEGPPGTVDGLGLLEVETTLTGDKSLRLVAGECLINGAPFTGYEMHVGETGGPDCARPLVRFADGRQRRRLRHWSRRRLLRAWFADDRQRAAWLASLGVGSAIDYHATVEETLDALADHLEAHLDCDAILKAAR